MNELTNDVWQFKDELFYVSLKLDEVLMSRTWAK